MYYFHPNHQKLLSFKDIRYNGFYVETTNDNHKEYLNIRKVISGNKNVFDILLVLSCGLYYTNIRMVESHVIENKRCDNTFKVWHDRLDHPGSIMMHRVFETSNVHFLETLEDFSS